MTLFQQALLTQHPWGKLHQHLEHQLLTVLMTHQQLTQHLEVLSPELLSSETAASACLRMLMQVELTQTGRHRGTLLPYLAQ